MDGEPPETTAVVICRNKDLWELRFRRYWRQDGKWLHVEEGVGEAKDDSAHTFEKLEQNARQYMAHIGAAQFLTVLEGFYDPSSD